MKKTITRKNSNKPKQKIKNYIKKSHSSQKKTFNSTSNLKISKGSTNPFKTKTYIFSKNLNNHSPNKTSSIKTSPSNKTSSNESLET
jgi:hypothetical protein